WVARLRLRRRLRPYSWRRSRQAFAHPSPESSSHGRAVRESYAVLDDSGRSARRTFPIESTQAGSGSSSTSLRSHRRWSLFKRRPSDPCRRDRALCATPSKMRRLFVPTRWVRTLPSRWQRPPASLATALEKIDDLKDSLPPPGQLTPEPAVNARVSRGRALK